MDHRIDFRGRTARQISSVSGIDTEDLYEIRGELARNLATMDAARAVFETARFAVENDDFDHDLSDIWHYGLYMNYVDLYEGSEQSGLQSWRPVSGKALELTVGWYYDENTPDEISVTRVGKMERSHLGQVLDATGWDSNQDGKLDLAIGLEEDGNWYLLGGIHVKPSFKGRTHHDAKFSDDLIDAGLMSPIVTLDIWTSDDSIENEGQLNSDSGLSQGPREIVEQDGRFTNIYSFNEDTEHTTGDTPSGFGVYGADQFIDDVKEFAEEFETAEKEARIPA